MVTTNANPASPLFAPTVKWCSVDYEEALAAMRLEASVFGIDGRHARQAVNSCRFGTVPFNSLISSAYYPVRFKRIYCGAGAGVPFFLPSQINEIYPKPEKWISALTNCDKDELRLKRGNVLLTRSGTIGSVSFVSKTQESTVYSDDVIRITTSKPTDAGFLYAYLRSRTGNTILQTGKYGAVIQHIEPVHLADIPVPDAPDELKTKIHNLVVRSYELRDESNALLDEATALLVKELALPPIAKFQKGRLAFTVEADDLNNRFDASFHIPVVKNITAHLEKHVAELTTVGDKRISKNIILPGRFKRVYVEEGQGRVFFSGKNIGELDPSDKKYLSFAQHGTRIRAELTIHHNMILVTCSGSIGSVTLVPQHWDGWTMTHDIIRLVPNEETAGFLYIWLQSEYGKTLLEAQAYGAVVQHIEKEHIATIPVPLLKNQSAQTEINALASRANALRHTAYQLEQEALKTMNNEVIFTKGD